MYANSGGASPGAGPRAGAGCSACPPPAGPGGGVSFVLSLLQPNDASVKAASSAAEHDLEKLMPLSWWEGREHISAAPGRRGAGAFDWTAPHYSSGAPCSASTASIEMPPAPR